MVIGLKPLNADRQIIKIMKKLILKSEIKKMGLTEKEMLWADEMQDVELSRLYFRYPYVGPIACIPTMYRKAVIYFAKEYIKSTGEEQTSLSRTSGYVANKFGTYPGAITRILKGLSSEGQHFIVSDNFGLDCITLR